MVRSTILVALVLLVLIQSVFVESWWSRRRRRSRTCNHPTSSASGLSFYIFNFTIEFCFHRIVLMPFGLRARQDVCNSIFGSYSLLLYFLGAEPLKTGPCWHCKGPLYTQSFVIISKPRLYFGFIWRTLIGWLMNQSVKQNLGQGLVL